MDEPIDFFGDLFCVLDDVGQVLLGERARWVEIVRLGRRVNDVIRDLRLVEELMRPRVLLLLGMFFFFLLLFFWVVMSGAAGERARGE